MNFAAETQNQEEDILGINTNFLDDVEMAEQWLRKEDEEEPEIELPVKRGRERIWQNFINTNIVADDVVEPDPPENEVRVKEEVLENGLKDGSDPNEIVIVNDKEENEVVPKGSKKKHQKKIVKHGLGDIVINAESQIGLDSTADIVKNTRLFQKLVEIIPNDMEQMFYMSITKDIAPELENFFLSHVKIQRLKNLFREEEEEKEPVILSNIAAERPDNPIASASDYVDNSGQQMTSDSLPKVEKIEERNEETAECSSGQH